MNTEKNEKLLESIAEMDIMVRTLLDKELGCPWDREQTPHTLSEYNIEECFELVDAIRKDEPHNVCDEMGDLVFGIMLLAHKYSEKNQFDFADAIQSGIAKMKRRHPHVFQEKNNNKSMEELHNTWEAIKKAEKKEKQGALSSIPNNLPALTRAYRIHAKSAIAGFTWDDEEDVERQVEAEWLELLDAKASGDVDAMTHELGDMIFALTEMGRRMGVKASYAVDLTNNRFTSRFEGMEKLATQRGLDFSSLTLDEKDELWEEVKKNLG